MPDVGYEAEIDELSQQVKVFVAETKQQMEVFVAEAKKAASIAGKPLLVVYGEDHMSEHDLIAQAILLKVKTYSCWKICGGKLVDGAWLEPCVLRVAEA